MAGKKTHSLLHSSKKSSVQTAACSDSAGASQVLKTVPSVGCSRKTPTDKDSVIRSNTGPPQNKIPGSPRGSGKIMPQASLFADALSGTGKCQRQATSPLYGGTKSSATRNSEKTSTVSKHVLKTPSMDSRQTPTTESRVRNSSGVASSASTSICRARGDSGK